LQIFLDEDQLFHDRVKFQKELNKYYSFPPNETQFPDDAYLLLPGVLKAKSVEITKKHQARIHIWYKDVFRGNVNLHMQLSYDVIRKGSIVCKGVTSVYSLPYEEKSKITNTFGNLYKIITVPVDEKSSVQIRCRTLQLESIGNYVLHAGKMVSHKEFLQMVSGMKA